MTRRSGQSSLRWMKTVRGIGMKTSRRLDFPCGVVQAGAFMQGAERIGVTARSHDRDHQVTGPTGAAMKRGRSTGKPTKEEAEWIVAVKEGPCLACYLWTLGGWWCGCDAHHLLSGGRRIGHMATVGLCGWHHRGVPHEGETVRDMEKALGPSLMSGSKTFHEAYGSDDTLLTMQKNIIEHGMPFPC